MDFGIVGLNGLGSSNNSGYASLASDPETKQKLYGSGLYKQDRSDSIDDNLRSSKLSKTGDFLASKDMLFQQRNNNCSLRSIFSDINEHQQKNQQMLSFSSPKPESFLANNCQNASLPCLYNSLSTYTRNSGYNCLNWNGAIAGARGPFTPSQWLELEHQALIYKYITSNVPIPSNLLLPIQRALDSAGLSAFSGGYLRPNRLGWGSIHLGFSNNTDPEPGRCRRTDGKKWRCSRDAVADQKYCERHLNRGRHRSRKPVEGQTGQSATRTTSMVTTKPTPMSSLALSSVALPSSLGNQVTTKPTPMSSLALSSVALPSGLGNQQLQSLELRSSNASAGGTHTNRMLLKDNDDGEKIQDTPGLFLMSKENSFLIQKQKNPYEDQSTREFGLVTSDSLLNPSQKSTSLISCRNFGSSQDLVNQEAESQHSLHQFIDDWPNKTQLSIAIPMGASTDFIPSSSSTNNEKITLSPLRLSREVDPELMGLGMGNEQNNEQTNWIPISWDQNSVGGPLGEVLNHSNNYNILEKERSSVLNLMTEGWDNSPSIGSSPTGVLQKTSFGSVSNSSAGSSPRAENNKTHEGASLCNDHLLGSTTLFSSSSSSLPAL